MFLVRNVSFCLGELLSGEIFSGEFLSVSFCLGELMSGELLSPNHSNLNEKKSNEILKNFLSDANAFDFSLDGPMISYITRCASPIHLVEYTVSEV